MTLLEVMEPNPLQLIEENRKSDKKKVNSVDLSVERVRLECGRHIGFRKGFRVLGLGLGFKIVYLVLCTGRGPQ